MQKEKNQSQNNDELNEVELCEKCGAKLVFEGGKMICPDCSSQIDFFGDSDE